MTNFNFFLCADNAHLRATLQIRDRLQYLGIESTESVDHTIDLRFKIKLGKIYENSK